MAIARVGVGGVDAASCDDPVPWSDAADHSGQRAAIAGPVAAVTFVPQVGGQPTFVNLGNPHPDPRRFDVVVYRDVHDRFANPLTESLVGRNVCVIGTVRLRDDVPQIVVGHPAAFQRR